ncbi:MAG: molecular chaperone [Neisseria sp.]|nr:molecular chaperone [Neisseria sp.]
MYRQLMFWAVLLLMPFYAAADVAVIGTRAVYPGDAPLIEVNTVNRGKKPALVQAWVENGKDGGQEVPFVLTPPLSRVEGGREQVLRIVYTGEPLPQDRESLFYLNVMEIPPKQPGSAGKNMLNLSFTHRLKFFYRPAGLAYPVYEAYGKVKWRRQGRELLAENPTPYYLTFSFVGTEKDGRTVAVQDTAMIGPFASHTFRLRGDAAAGGKVKWEVINDYGGFVLKEAALPEKN